MSLKIIFLLSLGIIIANFGIQAVPLHNAPKNLLSDSKIEVALAHPIPPVVLHQIPAGSEESSEKDAIIVNSRTKRAIISNRGTGQRARSNSLPASLPSRQTGFQSSSFNPGNSFGGRSRTNSFSGYPSTSLLDSRSTINTGTGGNLFANNALFGSKRPRSDSLSSTRGLFGSGQFGNSNPFFKTNSGPSPRIPNSPGNSRMWDLPKNPLGSTSRGYGHATSSGGSNIELPNNSNKLSHIFRSDRGHVQDTPENRQMLVNLANNKNKILGQGRPDRHGNTWSAEILPDGRQSWVSFQNNRIQNGGINNVPRPFNPDTGLAAEFKPGFQRSSKRGPANNH